jgi:glycosyltransferase involved in cell wall biosynthesis
VQLEEALGRKKIVYIISDIDKALSFEWIAQKLVDRWNLVFILIGDKKTQLALFLAKESVPFYEISDAQHRNWFSKWAKIFRLLSSLKPDAVHTHLWRANLLGLSASWILRIKKRIYTRHHALVHYQEFKRGRAGDLLCNFCATHIIAISKNIQHILIDRDKASAKKIEVIYHGFDLNYFENVKEERIQALKSKYQISQSALIVGVIARYQEWKGIQYIIPAFKKLLHDYPLAHLVLANANGNFKSEIQAALGTLPKDKFTEINFESDLASLYRIFNVYVHVPIDSESEAFGQTYVEALAAGIPSVFTLSGVASEFIVHEKNALVAEFKDSESVYSCINRLLSDESLRKTLITNGKKSVEKFSLERMVQGLENLYSQ